MITRKLRIKLWVYTPVMALGVLTLLARSISNTLTPVNVIIAFCVGFLTFSLLDEYRAESGA